MGTCPFIHEGGSVLLIVGSVYLGALLIMPRGRVVVTGGSEDGGERGM